MEKRVIIRVSDILYFLIALMIFCSVMQNTLLRYSFPSIGNGIDYLYKLLRIIVLMIGIFHFTSKKQNLSNVLLCLIFLVIFFFNFLNTKYYMFFDMFFIPIFLYDILDYKKTVNTYFKVLVISLVIIILLYLLKLFPESVFSIYRNSKFELRESFGFGHPNGFGRHMFLIVALLFLKNEDDIKLYNILLTTFMTLIVYVTSRCMTAVYLMLLIIIYMICLKLFKNFRIKLRLLNLVKKPSFLVIPVLAIISYMIFSKGLILDKLASLSNTLRARYMLATAAISKYGFSLFGNKVQIVGKAQTMFDSRYSSLDYSQVDNFFIYFSLTIGVLAIIFWIIYYTYSYKKVSRMNNKYLSFILLIMLIYSFMENSLVLFSSAFIYMLPMCNYMANLKNMEVNDGKRSDR